MRKRVAEEAAASLVAKQREVHWAAAGQGVEGYALGPGFLLEEMTADRRRGLTCFTRGRSDVPSDLRIWAGLHHRPHQIYTQLQQIVGVIWSMEGKDAIARYAHLLMLTFPVVHPGGLTIMIMERDNGRVLLIVPRVP